MGRLCEDVFVFACYTIAFKWEDNAARFKLSELVASLKRFIWHDRELKFCKIHDGVMLTAEIIVLDCVNWKILQEDPLIHIDHLMWNAGKFPSPEKMKHVLESLESTLQHGKLPESQSQQIVLDSVLRTRAIELASDVAMDPAKLNSENYSPFYAACCCVQQACEELTIAPHLILGKHFR